jgi:hypothetical protein
VEEVTAVNNQGSGRRDLAGVAFTGNYPSDEDRQALLGEYYFQRAVQVYLTALPAVNVIAMRDGSEAAFGRGYHVLPVWKKRMDAKCKVTTPNADVVYAMSYLDLAQSGPLVVAAPPGIMGMLTDFWQRCLSDVGFLGPDKGQGGQYLLLPPHYDGPDIPGGYYVLRSPTYKVFLFWRAFLTRSDNGPDPAQAVAAIENTMIFPFHNSNPGSWPQMEFPDASGVPVNMLYPRDATYFDKLAKFIDEEPADSVDLVLRGMMASIGIVKGRPFTPDERQRAILEHAARLAPKIAGSIAITPDIFPGRRYYTGPAKRQWINAFADVDENFNTYSYRNLEQQSAYFLVAYSASPAMAASIIGSGAKYPSTFCDADGNYLSGEHTYHLHLPPDPPARLFWAVTLYNPADGTMIDNGQPFPSVNALDNRVAINDDHSVDLYFGPGKPADAADANWIKTNPGEGYLCALRLYGPTKPFFDQTWIPDDVVKLT